MECPVAVQRSVDPAPRCLNARVICSSGSRFLTLLLGRKTVREDRIQLEPVCRTKTLFQRSRRGCDKGWKQASVRRWRTAFSLHRVHASNMCKKATTALRPHPGHTRSSDSANHRAHTAQSRIQMPLKERLLREQARDVRARSSQLPFDGRCCRTPRLPVHTAKQPLRWVA